MDGGRGEGRPPHREAEAVLRARLPDSPEVFLVLGSGLGSVVEAVEEPVEVPFAEILGFPPPGVPGHAGRFVGGKLAGRRVLVQAGRYHLYEGHPAEVVAAPVRAAAALGIRTVVLTNAAGGIHAHLEPGDLLLIHDHLNLMWRNPLAGPVREGEVRFPDMSAPYDPELQALAEKVARRLRIRLPRGTYAAVLGPAYETSAEVRMLGALGADVVGMSTVPEVLVARAAGLRVLAFSLVTNRATGLGTGGLRHEEVLEAGRRGGELLARLLTGILPALP